MLLGGSLSALADPVTHDDGTVSYTATFTSDATSPISITVSDSAYYDLAGNFGAGNSLDIVLNNPPVAEDDGYISNIFVGLKGEYWGYNDSGSNSDGPNLTNLTQVEAFMLSKQADASFIATTIDYVINGDNLGSDGKLQDFLGDDAASLEYRPPDNYRCDDTPEWST
jgi:hypothetical protein